MRFIPSRAAWRQRRPSSPAAARDGARGEGAERAALDARPASRRAAQRPALRQRGALVLLAQRRRRQAVRSACGCHAPGHLENGVWLPDAELRAAQKLYTHYLPELERIKQRMALERAPPSPPRHAPGAQPLTTSNLPEIANWGVPAAPSAPPLPLPPGEARAGPPPGPGGPEFAGAAIGADLDWDLLSTPAAPARQLRATASAPSAAAAGAAAPVDDLLGRLQVAPCTGRAWRCCAPPGEPQGLRACTGAACCRSGACRCTPPAALGCKDAHEAAKHARSC